MTKVYCVHLINKLKYDVMFTDVDLVLYRNPTEYFNNPHKQQQQHEQFDIYISDNGTDDENRFRPYHGNTGFYYIRYNKQTQYFLYCLLKSGDLILADNSHQSVFLSIAYEHSVQRNLRIKTLYNRLSYAKYLVNNTSTTMIDPNDNELILSGYEYKSNHHLMEMMINGEVVPFIFHANRYEGDDKVNVLIETKNWYMKYDQCSTSELLIETYNNINTNKSNNLLNECCLSQPFIK